MEDYLNVYVHALASYRGVNEEDVEGMYHWTGQSSGSIAVSSSNETYQNVPGLMKKLIALSESCPDDIGEIMPPSISGLVYNQVSWTVKWTL